MIIRRILYILTFVFFYTSSIGQITYDPSLHIPINKSLGVAQAAPTDARSMLYDPTYLKYRPYVSPTEVFNYLYLPKFREGGFDIIINTGGTLNAGVITGGTNSVWWFNAGTSFINLVPKITASITGGKNADSIKSKPVDTGMVARDNYVLLFDSANKKFVLAPQSANYTAGTGITISGNAISALTTSAIWNANSLRGRNITTATPAVGTGPVWSGTQFDFVQINTNKITKGYIGSDTMYLISSTDSVKIPNTASKTYVDSVLANFNPPLPNFDVTFLGTGTGPDPIHPDTTFYYFTQTQASVNFALVNARIDSLIAHLPAGGVGGKTAIISNSTGADSIYRKVNDSLYVLKKPKNGANTTVFTTDSTFGFNASPGSAEVNTDAFSLSASGTRSVSSGIVVDYVEVSPVSDLLQFKMGTSTDDDAYIFPTPCPGGKWTIIFCFSYFPAGDTVYFSGITSSTQIKIHKQIQHE